MPIYEFQCKECIRDFKTLRRADKLNEVTCPTCGTDHIMRLLSVTAQVSAEQPSFQGGGCGTARDAASCCMRAPGG
ncbi:MAG: zinc ribbon domain-containing protein [Armatimonadetes bacterium]|nr:zinc ribbon domain-containing protein [Armatimonadota bacterium]